MVTAPVQKSLINQAGVAFSGHTEYIAERTHAPLAVMMLTPSRVPEIVFGIGLATSLAAGAQYLIRAEGELTSKPS